MKKNTFPLLLTLLLSLVFSCQEEQNPNPNPNPNPPVASKPLAKMVDVNVTLPQGVSIDLSKTKLSTGLMDFNVDASGKSKAVLPDGIYRMAYLLDESNRILLMGILHDQNKKLDAETTAEALFYLGAGIYFRPEPIIREYLTAASTLPGMPAFKEKITQMIKDDIGLIDKGAFEAPLAAYLTEFSKAVDPIDIRARQINVNPTGFQSGIQIFENDALSVKLANTYRRRAHAFFYKTAYKSKGSKDETVLLSNIGAGEKAVVSAEIEPTNAFSSTLGTIVDWAMNNGIEYARKETGPINLPLGDNEDEATYKVRVVGTAFYPELFPMTADEKKTWEKLMVKQFYLDFIAPILTEMFSEIKGNQDTSFGFEAFEYFLSQSPTIWQLLEKGDWKNAATETVKYLLVDKAGQELQKKFITLLVDKYKNLPTPTWIDLDRDYNNASAVEKYTKLIKAVELTVKLLDMTKLTGEIAMSNRIDVFTAKSIRSDVTISPKEASVVPLSNLELKAETKTQLSEGQSFVYKWSTTGKYGVVLSGNQKGVSIETSTNTVNFRSESKTANLEENNYETVTVEVYIKSGTTQTLVGEGKATINVKKLKLVMRPEKITLMGGQSVRLYLERTDGVNDIVSNDVLDYKVEWETSGKYGKFNGTLKSATTMGNALNYEALDKKVKEGVESFIARVYFKAKTDSEWTLRDIVRGELTVANDPKKVVLDIPLSIKPWDNSTDTKCVIGVNYMAIIPVHPKAVRYTVTFYGFKVPYRWENRRVTWVPSQRPPSEYTYPGASPKLIIGNDYYFTISANWGTGAMGPNCALGIERGIAVFAPMGGRANVVIEITD